MNKALLSFLVLLATSTAGHAESCEDLKASIDAKIRAAGVSSFSLAIVDAAASAPGRTVGTCGLGKQRIVYTAAAGSAAAVQPAAPSASATSARAPDRPRHGAVITECKDGSVRPDCGRRP